MSSASTRWSNIIENGSFLLITEIKQLAQDEKLLGTFVAIGTVYVESLR